MAESRPGGRDGGCRRKRRATFRSAKRTGGCARATSRASLESYSAPRTSSTQCLDSSRRTMLVSHCCRSASRRWRLRCDPRVSPDPSVVSRFGRAGTLAAARIRQVPALREPISSPCVPGRRRGVSPPPTSSGGHQGDEAPDGVEVDQRKRPVPVDGGELDHRLRISVQDVDVEPSGPVRIVVSRSTTARSRVSAMSFTLARGTGRYRPARIPGRGLPAQGTVSNRMLNQVMRPSGGCRAAPRRE